jgi:hypothetical protein
VRFVVGAHRMGSVERPIVRSRPHSAASAAVLFSCRRAGGLLCRLRPPLGPPGAEEVSKLSTEMQLLTGSAELPTRAFEALATNIVDGSKRAQAALKDLAISQADQARNRRAWTGT